ncbi:MAG: hypothetical protein EXS13_06700 [Planctomycetes bacterium]|nr:hypothetical protein [Planctomycetota bacterium]
MGILHQTWWRLQSPRRAVVSLALAMVGTVSCRSSADAPADAPVGAATSIDPATLARVCGRVS